MPGGTSEVNKREATAVIDHHEASIQRIREFKSMQPEWVWRELLRLGGPWRMLPSSYELGDCKDTKSNRYCFIVKHTRDLPDITPAELALVQNDKTIMGLIDRNNIHSVRYASEVNEMLEQIERTLERIESGLDLSGR